MSSKHFLALVALAVWSSAGCASILGVESDDYADAAAFLCACGDGSETCKGAIQDALATDRGADLEALLLGCIEGAPACTELGNCIVESDYVGAQGEPCLVFGVAKPREVLPCAEGLACDRLRNVCSCGAPNTRCSAPSECCSNVCATADDGSGRCQ